MPNGLMKRMHIVPIPRGGVIVAGWLAYALNASQTQFFDDGKSPVCLVDDCALTGKRFGQVLRRFRGRDVWFCHLASAPELRQAIVAQEPQVRGCLAADDLMVEKRDVSEQIPAQGRYLTMSVEPVVFPWTEPNVSVTVPFSDQVEDGWRLMPPHAVLGNLALLNLPPAAETLLVNIQASSQVVWRVCDNELLLYEGRCRKLFELSGMAADLWKGCAGYQNRRKGAEWGRSKWKDETAEVAESIIDELVAKKLLVQL